MRALMLGGLIGFAVLAATALIPREHVPRRPPSFPHHQLQDGRAELNLPPGTAGVFLYDERLWPTEAWAPAARDAAESGRWAGSGAGVVSAMLPGPARRPLPVTVRLARSEPRLAAADDHVVDLDVRIVSGGLVVGSTHALAADFIAIPVGAYRARIAGRVTGSPAAPPACASTSGRAVTTSRRRWPGWTS